MEYLPEASFYKNESERNIHVWCSLIRRCLTGKKQFIKKPTLGLVAGCYIHKNWLPVSVFYKWLDMILEVAEYSKDGKQIALFHLSDDPRQHALLLGKIPLPSSNPLPRDLDDTMKKGHYIIYLLDNAQNFTPFWPDFKNVSSLRQSETLSRRNSLTRNLTRIRDKRCVITGQEVPARDRGGNFTGFEVAHIFPLMAANDPLWKELVPESARHQVASRQLADNPHNAMLLRADIHKLFDDFQWSIWDEKGQEEGRPLRVVRFEKTGAVVLNEHDETVTHLDLLGLTETPPCSRDLFMAHFCMALLTHVRGVGKRAAGGYQKTLI